MNTNTTNDKDTWCWEPPAGLRWVSPCLDIQLTRQGYRALVNTDFHEPFSPTVGECKIAGSIEWLELDREDPVWTKLRAGNVIWNLNSDCHLYRTKAVFQSMSGHFRTSVRNAAVVWDLDHRGAREAIHTNQPSYGASAGTGAVPDANRPTMKMPQMDVGKLEDVWDPPLGLFWTSPCLNLDLTRQGYRALTNGDDAPPAGLEYCFLKDYLKSSRVDNGYWISYTYALSSWELTLSAGVVFRTKAPFVEAPGPSDGAKKERFTVTVEEAQWDWDASIRPAHKPMIFHNGADRHPIPSWPNREIEYTDDGVPLPRPETPFRTADGIHPTVSPSGKVIGVYPDGSGIGFTEADNLSQLKGNSGPEAGQTAPVDGSLTSDGVGVKHAPANPENPETKAILGQPGEQTPLKSQAAVKVDPDLCWESFENTLVIRNTGSTTKYIEITPGGQYVVYHSHLTPHDLPDVLMEMSKHRSRGGKPVQYQYSGFFTGFSETEPPGVKAPVLHGKSLLTQILEPGPLDLPPASSIQDMPNEGYASISIQSANIGQIHIDQSHTDPEKMNPIYLKPEILEANKATIQKILQEIEEERGIRERGVKKIDITVQGKKPTTKLTDEQVAAIKDRIDKKRAEVYAQLNYRDFTPTPGFWDEIVARVLSFWNKLFPK